MRGGPGRERYVPSHAGRRPARRPVQVPTGKPHHALLQSRPSRDVHVPTLGPLSTGSSPFLSCGWCGWRCLSVTCIQISPPSLVRGALCHRGGRSPRPGEHLWSLGSPVGPCELAGSSPGLPPLLWGPTARLQVPPRAAGNAAARRTSLRSESSPPTNTPGAFSTSKTSERPRCSDGCPSAGSAQTCDSARTLSTGGQEGLFQGNQSIAGICQAPRGQAWALSPGGLGTRPHPEKPRSDWGREDDAAVKALASDSDLPPRHRALIPSPLRASAPSPVNWGHNGFRPTASFSE